MRPNIILINCDDLGYGDLGCFGSKLHDTPNIDKMASEGMRFTDFYMTSPVCSPSRGSMMTGCYPPRIGFGSFDDNCVLLPGQRLGLNPNEKTIASILKQGGYKTMLVGKWHCGDQPEFLPTNHGFDEYYGLPYSNDMGRQKGQKNPLPPLPLMRNGEVIQQQPDQSTLTERYTEQAVRFIRDNVRQPFFLYFAHMHVHLPHYVFGDFMKKSRNGSYGAAVACIDWSTGAILNEIKQTGLDNNTLIIFTSDNGSRNDYGSSNGPLRGVKGTTWEGGMRVPCIMRWPGHVPEGTKCSEIVTSMDFYPTFAELAGTDIPDDRIIDGWDIRKLMMGEQGEVFEKRTFFYFWKNGLEAVRAGRWKLHVRKQGEEIRALYDLKEDAAEINNIFDENSEIVKALEELLETCRSDLGDDYTQKSGKNVRPVGETENPQPLTNYDPEHPYIIAMYDKEESG